MVKSLSQRTSRFLFVDSSPGVRSLWCGFLLVWSVGQLFIGAMVPWMVAVTAAALGALHLVVVRRFPAPLQDRI